MIGFRRITAAGMAVVAVAAVGCGNSDSSGSSGGSGGDIKIGSIEDISGPIGPYGKAIVNGTKLAIDEANAGGGVLGGRKVQLTSQDSASNKATVPSLMRKLSGSHAIIGPTSSSALVISAPVAKQLKTVLVAPTSSETFEDGTLNEWTFRVAPTEGGAFKDLFGKMKGRLNFQRVALFYDDANNASVEERKLLEEHAGELGYQVVAAVTSPEGRTDVAGAVSKVLAAKPDVIFVSHLVPESASFMKTVRARGSNVPFVGGAPFATTQIFQIAGKAGEGAMTFVPFLATAEDAKTQDFVKAYTDKYGSAPDQFAALGYTTGKTVLAAIDKAGSDSADKIREAMSQLKGVEGPTGSVSYEGGPDNATPQLVLVEVKDGKFVPVS